MASLRAAFDQQGWDQSQYDRYLKKHTSEKVRRKLRTLNLNHQQTKLVVIVEKMALSLPTIRTYITTFAQGGFAALCQPEVRPRAGRLTSQQAAEFKHILLTSRPSDHHIEASIWTAEPMRAYLRQAYGVDYRSGIYNLLEPLRLSHQRAHADYGNADPAEQQACWHALEAVLLSNAATHAVVAFDEFSVSEKPSSYYGWAEKNTRPLVVTDEKKGVASMGC